MPGLCGILTNGPAEPPSLELRRMSRALTAAPDSQTGACLEPGFPLGVAWKTGGGVFRHCQPAWNADRTVGLLLAGEAFGAGPGAAAGREAELQHWLELYARSGWAFLDQLNGSFSGVLLDLGRRQAGVFTDRFGLGRLYYCESPQGCWFASEAKALLAARAELRRLDERGLGEWLACGCALQGRTLYAGVSLMPAGALWVVSAEGVVSKGRYFDPAKWEQQPRLPAPEYAARLREVFPRVLSRYFQGPEPVAMSLTGGLDGRMIMAWSGRAAKSLPCYTFNGPYRECADVRLARRVASLCGQEHQAIPVGAEFLNQFPSLAEQAVALADGAMDVTGAVELYVNRLARQIAPVRMTGNYGSEILRRYVAFRPRQVPAGIWSAELEAQGRAAAGTYAQEARIDALAFIAFKQVPWHHFARFAVERAEIAVRSPFLDAELVRLAFQAPSSAAGQGVCLDFIAAGNPALGRIPTDRGVIQAGGGLANRLRKETAEFLAKAEYAYDYGMPHWLARCDGWLSGLQLERLFLGRQKFCHFRTWYRHQLGPYVQGVLLDPRSLSRPYVNRAAVEQKVQAHLAGRENWTSELHKLLTLELLQRVVLESV